MDTVTLATPSGNYNPFSPDFMGYPDELPLHVEFYRPESLRPVDADGFELPPWENPYFTIPADDAEVEHTDWTTGETIYAEAEGPSADDAAWLAANPATYKPTEEDWDDYYEFRAEEEAAERAARDERARDEAASRYNLYCL